MALVLPVACLLLDAPPSRGMTPERLKRQNHNTSWSGSTRSSQAPLEFHGIVSSHRVCRFAGSSTALFVIDFARDAKAVSPSNRRRSPKNAETSQISSYLSPLDNCCVCGRRACVRCRPGQWRPARPPMVYGLPCRFTYSDLSTTDQAPPFATIAKTPGLDAAKIALFLLNPHPKMPDMQLWGTEAEDLAAYIAALK